MDIKPFHINIDKIAKRNSKPAPRKSTAINHNRKCKTFLSTRKANKPKIGNTNRNNKPNIANHT